MKTVWKIAGYVLGAVVVVVIILVSYLVGAFPKVSPAVEMTIEATPERLARGNYLIHHVAGCIDCHSTRDWSKFAGPIKPGTEGKGGEKFDKELAGLPGTVYSQNITPTYLKRYTDGQLYRLITTGVTYDGRAIFPLMPYMAYGRMDPEDVKSIIAYVRTLPPQPGEYPKADLDFPMNLIVRTIPKNASPMIKPDPSDTLKYGEYLFTVAGCSDCHTQRVKGDVVPGMELAGGFVFHNPATGDIIRSANITQDYETGIGLWTEEVFLGKFRTYRDSSWQNKTVKPREFNTIMPWLLFSGMEDADLKAIYRYLKTVPPVTNKVEKFTPKL